MFAVCRHRWHFFVSSYKRIGPVLAKGSSHYDRCLLSFHHKCWGVCERARKLWYATAKRRNLHSLCVAYISSKEREYQNVNLPGQLFRHISGLPRHAGVSRESNQRELVEAPPGQRPASGASESIFYRRRPGLPKTRRKTERV